MERSLFVFNSLKLTVERHPLRSPAFLRLWLGLSISYVGDQFTTIALLWFVLQLTGSGVAISLVLLCFQLPAMLTGPLLGTVLPTRCATGDELVESRGKYICVMVRRKKETPSLRKAPSYPNVPGPSR